MFRIGHGYDLHRLVAGKPLMLGGLRVPAAAGAEGHSDADALIHAVVDAFLGALALGDIGRWFPDTDPRYAGVRSGELLRHVLEHPCVAPWSLVNLDATILAEKPKLAPHIDAIRASLARLLGCSVSRVSVKAKTAEKTDAVGRGEAIAVHAVLLLERQA
jgi:2-C-methyl-D-erythritol 2,4-cyclodiphosphate synthase